MIDKEKIQKKTKFVHSVNKSLGKGAWAARSFNESSAKFWFPFS